MEPATLLALVAACVALAAIPGPNVALIVGNTLAHGARHGLATVAGTTLGIAFQVMLVALGLAVLGSHCCTGSTKRSSPPMPSTSGQP